METSFKIQGVTMKFIFAIGTLCLALATTAQAAPVTVEGDFIRLGVSDSGALIDHATVTGIQFDPSGSGNFAGAIDYLTPGTPFAFYSLGVNGSFGTAGGFAFQNNPFGATTINLAPPGASPNILTSGGMFGGLSFTQVLSFDLSSRTIQARLTFTNVTGTGLANVTYAVGFDPDQDVNYPESEAFDTDNRINGQGAAASVTAIGPGLGYGITLANASGWANTFAGNRFGRETNPYILSAAGIDDGFGDTELTLGYDLGAFAPGEQKSIGYDYTLFVTQVPEPGILPLMFAGLLVIGLGRRKAGAAPRT
jgi:hypothetical protein